MRCARPGICVLGAVVLIVGVGAVYRGREAVPRLGGEPAGDAVSVSLFGILLAQLVIGALGVLVFSGEYGTGMIRASLAVVPARLPVLWAKLIVLAGLVLPVTLLAAVAEFFLATAHPVGPRGVGDLAGGSGRAADRGRRVVVPDGRCGHRPGPGCPAPEDSRGRVGVRRGVLHRADRRGRICRRRSRASRPTCRPARAERAVGSAAGLASAGPVGRIRACCAGTRWC